MANRKRRRRRSRLIPILTALLLMIMVGIAGVITSYVKKYTPSDERMDLTEYYAQESSDEVTLILQDTISETKGRMVDGIVYLPYTLVSGSLGGRFYWDEDTQHMLYTLPSGLLEIALDSTSYEAEGKETQENYIIVRQIEGEYYIALDFLEQYMQLQGTTYENPARTMLLYQWGRESTVTAAKDTEVRYQGGIKSPILADIASGDRMMLLEEMENWVRVMTQDGIDGYVEKKDLKQPEEIEYIYQGGYEEEYTSKSLDSKVNLAWHQVTSEAANQALEQTIQDMTGVNVISPTWFSVTTEDGNISSLASVDYVKKAHTRGMEVWGLIDNFNEKVSTLNTLSSSSARRHIIDKLLEEAERVDLDGINVDFEALTEEEAPHFIQFIRELSIQCRKNDLILSIDNPVPQFTSFYNRKEQGIMADYIIIMGYDEHTIGSAEAGSVASLPFVEEGIIQTLNEVPKEKVINGVPFYTRLWTVYDNGTVSSEVFGMEQASQYVAEKKMEVYWNTEVSQNYAEAETDSGTLKMWMEDEDSLKAKMELIQEYDLAGVAAWKLGFERAEVWNVIHQYVQ